MNITPVSVANFKPKHKIIDNTVPSFNSSLINKKTPKIPFRSEA